MYATRTKPLLRGHSHQAAFFTALGAGMVLVATAPASTRIAAAIYTASLVCLLGTSALYHRPMWPERARDVLKRLDHSMIFVLIAGTYTPFCLHALPRDMGRIILAIMWGVALVLGGMKLAGVEMPRWLTTASYVGLGWFAAWSMPDALPAVGVTGLVLLVSGGIVYTVGAMIYWRKWPNPNPRVFGYHEIFHLLVVLASVLHFVAVARIVL